MHPGPCRGRFSTDVLCTLQDIKLSPVGRNSDYIRIIMSTYQFPDENASTTKAAMISSRYGHYQSCKKFRSSSAHRHYLREKLKLKLMVMSELELRVCWCELKLRVRPQRVHCPLRDHTLSMTANFGLLWTHPPFDCKMSMKNQWQHR